MERPDLITYFKRIGYRDGPRAATLETLCAIHIHHAQAIAFEALDAFSGRPVPLDLASLERKLLHEGRGGWCFEQNLLFSHVLTDLGFHVIGLAARVMWNAPEDQIRKRSHMVLLIEIGGERYIADVGFGGMTLTAPLRLVTDVEQPTSHEPFRLIERDGDYVLQACVRDVWKPLYRFDLQRQQRIDYEVPNWYLANHPQSLFVNNLVVARPVPGQRYGLLNKTLTIHQLGGESMQRTLASVAELRDVLESHFGLRLPTDDPRVEAALRRVVA